MFFLRSLTRLDVSLTLLTCVSEFSHCRNQFVPAVHVAVLIRSLSATAVVCSEGLKLKVLQAEREWELLTEVFLQSVSWIIVVLFRIVLLCSLAFCGNLKLFQSSQQASDIDNLRLKRQFLAQCLQNNLYQLAAAFFCELVMSLRQLKVPGTSFCKTV